MATKEKVLTADSITGAVHDDVKVRVGEHWMTNDDVVQVTLRQDEESNCANVYVLSIKAAYQLRLLLGERLNELERYRVARQPMNWPDFSD